MASLRSVGALWDRLPWSWIEKPLESFNPVEPEERDRGIGHKECTPSGVAEKATNATKRVLETILGSIS